MDSDRIGWGLESGKEVDDGYGIECLKYVGSYLRMLSLRPLCGVPCNVPVVLRWRVHQVVYAIVEPMLKTFLIMSDYLRKRVSTLFVSARRQTLRQTKKCWQLPAFRLIASMVLLSSILTQLWSSDGKPVWLWFFHWSRLSWWAFYLPTASTFGGLTIQRIFGIFRCIQERSTWR